MKFRWELKNANPEDVERLSEALNLGKIFSSILVSRGLSSPEKALDFLNPKLKNMHDPHLLYNMQEAVYRISRAVRDQEKICLYGDYDVDGITSISLLYQCLNLLHANVEYYIPDRVKEGYGMNTEAVEKIARKNCKLIVTVDCGISGHDAIAHANSLGMEVIVTDHHELGETLPDAIAILNPKDERGKYPFQGIAGVGVAFKVAWALCQEFSPEIGKMLPELRSFLLDGMALVALGTIADVAPLLDENRVIARYGLLALENSQNIGIKALKKISNLMGVSPLTSEHVGFRLGPRINAMGRLDHSFDCVQLLITRDEQKAHFLASQLDTQNQKRKSIQDKIYKQARQQIVERKLESRKVLILAQEEWHMGVVGVVASRLQEEYYRPVLIISLSDGVGRGSGRSIPGFHLFNALQSCYEFLIEYGGHELAAGFRIKKENIPDLERALNLRAEEMLRQEQMQPLLEIDCEIDLNDISWDLFHQIEKMAPFGEKNRRPILMTKNLGIVKNPPPERYGTRGEHASFRVQQHQKIFRAIAFGQGEAIHEALTMHSSCNLAYILKRNNWAGNDTLELEVKDISF